MQSNTSYLYEYEHHKRLRNAGFLKFHASSDLYLIRLHIKSPVLGSGIAWNLHAFSTASGICTLYPLDTVISDHQSLHLQIYLSAEHLPATVTLSQIDGLWLSGDSSHYFVTSWHQIAIPSEHVLFSTEPEDSCEEAPGSDSAANSQPLSAASETVEITSSETETSLSDVCEASENLSRKTCAVQPFDKVSSTPTPVKSPASPCRKISRQDLKHLPRRYWGLANNSFLLHGYYAYHHLIYIDRNGKSFLGVPGIFSQKEQRAARLFGFPEFSREYLNTLELDSDECSGCDHFGYWIRPVF